MSFSFSIASDLFQASGIHSLNANFYARCEQRRKMFPPKYTLLCDENEISNWIENKKILFRFSNKMHCLAHKSSITNQHEQ